MVAEVLYPEKIEELATPSFLSNYINFFYLDIRRF
jgi:hypothetical protein